MDSYTLTPVGYVRSLLKDRSAAPRQGRDASLEAEIEVLPPFLEALRGISQWPLLQVVCWMHLADRGPLAVHPRGDPMTPVTGVFGTRSPARPNPIAVYTVELLRVEKASLKVRGLDAVDGTPVLDIKPHIHRLDD